MTAKCLRHETCRLRPTQAFHFFLEGTLHVHRGFIGINAISNLPDKQGRKPPASLNLFFPFIKTGIVLYQFTAGTNQLKHAKTSAGQSAGTPWEDTKRLLAATAARFGWDRAQAEIKISSVLSVTGPASFLGDPEKKRLKCVTDINAGRRKRPADQDFRRDGGDANKARTFATRLVEKTKSDRCRQLATGRLWPTFMKKRYPYIARGSAAIVFRCASVFKTPHTEPMSCGKIFEDLKKRKLTKIGMISGTDGWGKAMREECLAMAPKEGVTVVKDENYNATDSDMTPQLTNIKNTPGIEAVINCGFGQGPAIVTRNYRQLGITAPLYQSHGVSSKSYINSGGPGRRNVRLPAAAVLVAKSFPTATR